MKFINILSILLRFISFLYIVVLNLGDDTISFPSPSSNHNRILAQVLVPTYTHIDALVWIVNEYVSMCEGGWKPTVVFITTIHWTPDMRRYLRQKSFCYKSNSSIDFRFDEHVRNPSLNKVELADFHRVNIKKSLENYDLFLYQDDEVVLKSSHLNAFVHETRRLFTNLPFKEHMDFSIGFQRYCRVPGRNDIHVPFGENDVLNQDLLEQLPSINPICINHSPYLNISHDTQQGLWILTKHQILLLEKKCGFLDQKSASSATSSEYISSLSIFSSTIIDSSQSCGLTKLIPAHNFYTFNVQHMFCEHWNSVPVFASNEHIRAGLDYQDPNKKLAIPECWKELVASARVEQVETHPSAQPARRLF